MREWRGTSEYAEQTAYAISFDQRVLIASSLFCPLRLPKTVGFQRYNYRYPEHYCFEPSGIWHSRMSVECSFFFSLKACPSARQPYVVHGWVKGLVARSQEAAEPPRVVSAISMSDSPSPLSRKVQMRRVARVAYARVIVARRR